MLTIIDHLTRISDVTSEQLNNILARRKSTALYTTSSIHFNPASLNISNSVINSYWSVSYRGDDGSPLFGEVEFVYNTILRDFTGIKFKETGGLSTENMG